MRVLVTGGCGFIGSAVVRHLIDNTNYEVVNVDKMTYAATSESVESVASNERYTQLKIDICNGAAVQAAFFDHQPDAVMHLAAESHVDRSIDGPEQFLQTNIVGTMHLLQAARELMHSRSDGGAHFRFLHVSTDEVFGALTTDDDPFHQESDPVRSRLALAILRTRKQSTIHAVPGELGRDVRTPGTHHQQFKQLWTVPHPREADSPRDTKGNRGSDTPGLWHR